MDDMAMRARVARQRVAMPQSQLADRTGVTRSAVANWEIGMRKKTEYHQYDFNRDRNGCFV